MLYSVLYRDHDGGEYEISGLPLPVAKLTYLEYSETYPMAMLVDEFGNSYY